MTEWREPVRDTSDPRPIIESVPRFKGHVWSVRSDRVRWDDSTEIVRDVVVHPGAVGIIALDEADHVLLVRQYRHPVGMYLFEAPAGLLDVPGEAPLVTAQRELLEETGMTADEWHVLVDFFNSPGGSTEAFRCYVARGVRPVVGERPVTGEAEESDLATVWLDLDDAKDLVLSGALANPTTCIGVLAAWAARKSDWMTLRPATAPWPAREALVENERVHHRDRRVTP